MGAHVIFVFFDRNCLKSHDWTNLILRMNEPYENVYINIPKHKQIDQLIRINKKENIVIKILPN